MADDKDKTETKADTKGEKSPVSFDAAVVRRRLAQVVWLVCALFALVLALGALTYALKANDDNGLVSFVRDFAGGVDLGVFTLENGIKEFVGKNSDIKNALFNWGLGAVFWLVVGRLLDRVIRP